MTVQELIADLQYIVENNKILENAQVLVYNNTGLSLKDDESEKIEGVHDEKGKVIIYF